MYGACGGVITANSETCGGIMLQSKGLGIGNKIVPGVLQNKKLQHPWYDYYGLLV